MAEEEILPARSERGGESEASLGDASLIDFEETKGLTKVFTDLVKPIANLNDPSKKGQSIYTGKKHTILIENYTREYRTSCK